MKKRLVLIIFTFFLTGCELNAYGEQKETDLEAIKSEIYQELKSSIDDEYLNLKDEILSELMLESDGTLALEISELKENLDSDHTLIEDINLRIDELVENSITDKETLKEELRTYVTNLISDLKVELEQATYTSSTPVDVEDFQSMIVNVVDKNTKAVLGVSNYQYSYGSLQVASTGSGVIYKKVNNDYYLVTNEHVVRDATKLRVVLEENVTIEATLLGSDLKTDLAVLKFNTTLDLPVSVFSDSDLLKRGQIAIAIGSPLGYDYYGTVTMGVISGLQREVEVDYNEDGTVDITEILIQHDVAINPGNSGGPLYNINGEIIGINNMKSVEEYVDNIGFAIPANTVIEVINRLES